MKIISKKIRNSANGEICSLRVSTLCDHNQSVVFAHLNSHYSGIALKSPDLFGVYACWPCHTMLDSSRVDAQDKLRAWQETLIKLVEKGLIEVSA